eukprot:jgi/Psemu1/3378/gm1.3378_g
MLALVLALACTLPIVCQGFVGNGQRNLVLSRHKVSSRSTCRNSFRRQRQRSIHIHIHNGSENISPPFPIGCAPDNNSCSEESFGGHPSRRDFVAWNALLASGLAAGWGRPSAAAAIAASASTTSSSSTVLGSAAANAAELPRAVVPYASIRDYKTITLSNGVTVLLVHDKNARQSSAALTINGAGQFSDPDGLYGLAHLMEHMVLSSKTTTTVTQQGRRRGQRGGAKKGGDFQEWLDGDYAEGFSNGFTAYEKVCFHFQCADEAFSEALDRFSTLFVDSVVTQTCRSPETIQREVRRVASELDKNDLFTRELYLTKSLANPDHPYARVTLGSIETLETLPERNGVDVSEELCKFFRAHYRPDQAILVVVGSAPLSSLEQMVQPFAQAMVRPARRESTGTSTTTGATSEMVPPLARRELPSRFFPPFLVPGKATGPICLFRGKVSNEILADNLEKISFQWALDQRYDGLRKSSSSSSPTVVTATQIGFVLAEILGRRGPGSLFPVAPEAKMVPRISFPVDVSGFQLLRLEIVVTLAGFANRSSVVAAVFEYLSCLRANPPSRELVAQYCSVAQLYGYVLAPRPPDAIELAFDGQIYGVGGSNGVGSPGWRLMPLPDDMEGVQKLQTTLQSVLVRLSDPSNVVTVMTASQKAIGAARQPMERLNDLEEPFPLLSPASWEISPTTQARYFPQNNNVLTGKINEWLLSKISAEKLEPPVLNPLIPPTLRPPRLPPGRITLPEFNNNSNSNSYVDPPQVLASYAGGSLDPESSSLVRDYWALLKVYSHSDPFPRGGISLPRAPPEASARSLFVLQLLSSRPPRATAEMAAHAEVWRISLEYALMDLSELGAPGGLAYEISYNKYGMRVAFLGLSQNIASYARRISRRMVDHTNQLLEGPDQIPDVVRDTAIRNTNRFRMSPKRKALVTNTLKQTTASDAAKEGTGFFLSCSGAVCFSQGDLLPAETLSLMADLKEIFRKTTGVNVRPSPAVPDVSDLLYRANWIPRAASVCTIAGASLVSNPCGRVPR